VHAAHDVGLELGRDGCHGHVLVGAFIAEAGVVDDDIQAAKTLDTRLHGRLGAREVGDVERQRQDSVAVALHQVIQPGGLPRNANGKLMKRLLREQLPTGA
jgi:acyl-coenzyme A synthetase/AMP-(fatty) acid ligase